MRSADLRARLDHPVVDADGHIIETIPVFRTFFLDYVKDIGGGDIAARFEASGGIDFDDMVLRPWSALSDARRRELWATRPSWWSLPAANTLDRATAHLPRLLYERLDEFGIDFAVLYPSRGLVTLSILDAELRQVACRALNAFNAEIYFPYADRMTPVAQIPTHTPAEALAELDHAVGTLGFKAIMINGVVHRPVGGAATVIDKDVPNWGSGSGQRLDTLGLDSEYDYDPVWKRCLELGVAPASHTPGMGWGSRRSSRTTCTTTSGRSARAWRRSASRCSWAASRAASRRSASGCSRAASAGRAALYADLLSHWEKRNRDAIHAARSRAHRHEGADGAVREVRRRALPRRSRRTRRVVHEARARAADARRVRGLPDRPRRGRARPVRAALLLRLRSRRPDGRVGVPLRHESARARSCARCSAPTSATGTCPTWPASSARRGSSSRTA
jgi:predicted TIM-barrel fold metal-dependent hydrolase